MSALKPISNEYMRDEIRLVPGKSRLHRLVARLCDTYIDDLSDERIIELEMMADSFRVTHSDGSRFSKSEAA